MSTSPPLQVEGMTNATADGVVAGAAGAAPPSASPAPLPPPAPPSPPTPSVFLMPANLLLITSRQVGGGGGLKAVGSGLRAQSSGHRALTLCSSTHAWKNCGYVYHMCILWVYMCTTGAYVLCTSCACVLCTTGACVLCTTGATLMAVDVLSPLPAPSSPPTCYMCSFLLLRVPYQRGPPTCPSTLNPLPLAPPLRAGCLMCACPSPLPLGLAV